MANILSPSDFVGMIMIPQIGATINTGAETVTPVNSALSQLIMEKEPEGLTKLLGYNFYNALSAGLAVPFPEERWTNLVEGTAYVVDGITYIYTGLRKLIARYVYYWWLRQDATQSTGVGEAINKTENAYRTSPAQKQVTAWNAMVEMCKSTFHYLYMNQSVYPEYIVPSNNCCIEFYLENWVGGWCYFDLYGYSYRCRRNEMLVPINTLNI